MGYYSAKELEQDLTAACERMTREFTGGRYFFEMFLDERSGFAECYITHDGIEPGDPEDLKDVIYEEVGSITDIYTTEMRMGEYDFQIIVEYNPI